VKIFMRVMKYLPKPIRRRVAVSLALWLFVLPGLPFIFVIGLIAATKLLPVLLILLTVYVVRLVLRH